MDEIRGRTGLPVSFMILIFGSCYKIFPFRYNLCSTKVSAEAPPGFCARDSLRRDMAFDTQWLIARFRRYSTVVQFNTIKYTLPYPVLQLMVDSKLSVRAKELHDILESLKITEGDYGRGYPLTRARINDHLAVDAQIFASYRFQGIVPELPLSDA